MKGLRMPPHRPQRLPALCSWEKNHSSRARREGTGESRKACTRNSGLRSCFPSLFKAGDWVRLFSSLPPAAVLSCLPPSFLPQLANTAIQMKLWLLFHPHQTQSPSLLLRLPLPCLKSGPQASSVASASTTCAGLCVPMSDATSPAHG